MSTNEAAERLPHEAIAAAMEREFSGWARPVSDTDWTNYGSRVELALWGLGYRVERSAGAAPLDVLREAFSDFDPCHECDNAEKAWAALALASKRTDR